MKNCIKLNDDIFLVEINEEHISTFTTLSIDAMTFNSYPEAKDYILLHTLSKCYVEAMIDESK